ncbi:MarR family winged helix-turn-helix transcriptional regulator [Megalodesulfovibrio paquesii]
MILKEMPSYQTLLKKAASFPDMDILVTEAYLHVLRTGCTLHRVAERHLATRGLSYGRFLVMALLSHGEEPLPVCRLAELSSVSYPTISALLSGMVRDGLVERVEDAKDRRVVRIALKEEGRALLSSVMPDILRLHGLALANLTPEELKTLISLLAKVRLDASDCDQEL